MPTTQLLSRVTPRGWIIGGGFAVAAILFIYIFLHTVSQPNYSTLVSGVDPSQTGKMTSTLSAQGISFQLQNNGTAIAVQSNETSKARVALAGADLLSGNSQPGFEIFDKQNLGESNFQQQVTYQRALQGQLSQTIDSVQGVSGAQVELVLPNAQNQIFGETQSTSTAAVLLSGTSALAPSAVQGIAQLVSSSVPGLQLTKVTITDASGALLWPQSGAGAGGTGTSVQAAEQSYDQQTAASIDAMLTQTVGVGKSQVLVYANMNVNQTTKEGLEYGKAGVPIHQSKTLETLTGTGAGAGGATGTANLTTAAASTAGGKSNYKHESTSALLGVSKTVTKSTVAPGVVENQHVSVLLDKSVPAASLPAIREAVSNAAGIEAKRGDTISIGQVAFAKPTSATAGAASSPLSYAKDVLLGIGALLFLFFTTRSLRRRETETIDEPVWLRELEAPMRLSELERENATRPTAVMAGVAPTGGNGNGNGNGNAAADSESIRKQVEQLAENEPDQVAEQLRSWMQED
jgi:flagellar M-ring protein FliF